MRKEFEVLFGSEDDKRLIDGEEIKLTTIDSLELERLDFIKLDIEGYELFALKGAEETIKRCKPLIAFEILSHASNYGYTEKQMFDYLIVGSGLFGSIFAYEANKIGKKVAIAHYYRGWDVLDSNALISELNTIVSNGWRPMVSVNPYFFDRGCNNFISSSFLFSIKCHYVKQFKSP